MASFKNCEPLLEMMVFQQQTLFVCFMDVMNHIIGTLVVCLYNRLIYYLYII